MRIRNTFLVTLGPPLLMVAVVLGALHWRSSIETQRELEDALERHARLSSVTQGRTALFANTVLRFETLHDRWNREFAAVMATAILLFLALAVLMARRLARPVEALTRAVEGPPDTPAFIPPVALNASGEIGQLARTFQRMRARLAASAVVAQRHERLLAETARGLDEAQRVSGVGSWTYDLQTLRVTWSDHQYRLLGFERGQVEPSYEGFLAAIHPDDRARVDEAVKRTIEAHSSFSYDCRVISDGKTRVLHALGQVSKDPKGEWVLAGTTQDVSERWNAEMASRASIERFELAARATHDSLWDWDITTDRVWWNNAFYDTFRYVFACHDPAPSRSALVHPEDADRVAASLQAFLASTRGGWSCEYRFRRADGSYVWVLDRGFVVRDPSGAPRRMLGSMMNVTARKEAERLRSGFVAFASHQLRTPLTGINWMLELALAVPDLPPAARKHVIDAEASGHRLVSLVNDLLDVSRLESGQLPMSLEHLDLEPLTRDVVEELRQSFADKKLVVVLKLDGVVCAVTADIQLLRQAIMNLLANAIAYTPAGETITIVVARHLDVVRWSVTDSGIGIPKEAKERLFEQFYRGGNAMALVPEGTGLGLHLVRLIIQQSGGTVWCHSDGEGTGATFTFEIPCEEAA